MNAQTEVVTGELELVRDPQPREVAVLQDLTPTQLVSVAAQRGATIEYLRELMQLEREWKADKAKEAFYVALAEFKKVAVTVTKDKVNKQYDSTYASLGNMVNTVNAAMAPFGLNANWEIDQTNGIKVTCVLSHTLGHCIKVPMTGPPDKSGSKNALQEVKSTITYLEGATFQAVTGVVSQDKRINPEDDGNGAGSDNITAEQIANLESLITEVGADKAAFLKYIKADSLEEISEKAYPRCVALVEAKRNQKKPPKDAK